MAIDKDLDFTGKTILVTGSGRNIGRAIMLEFAACGANVIMNSRTNEAEARGVEHEAQTLGAQTLVVMGAAGALTTVEDMQRRAEETLSMGARRCSGSVPRDTACLPPTEARRASSP